MPPTTPPAIAPACEGWEDGGFKVLVLLLSVGTLVLVGVGARLDSGASGQDIVSGMVMVETRTTGCLGSFRAESIIDLRLMVRTTLILDGDEHIQKRQGRPNVVSPCSLEFD